ncbi:MAG: pyridoxal phosphate-dependent aminotransferase [Collinsella sp.]
MQASQRLDRFGAEVFASLNNKLLALKAQGKTIYNMSVGTPDFKPYDHVVEALTQAAQDPEMWKYALRDLPELKQAVCDCYERRFGVSGLTPSMVQSCNGTQEGVGHLGLALLDPGDTILVPDPCYPVFEAGAKIADAKLEYYPLVAEHNYLPYVAGIDPEVADRAEVYDRVTARQSGGSVGTPEIYEEIIAFAREHDLLIVHDNAYSDIVFDGEPGGSFLQYPGALEVGVEFFSLSKSFNVTGARIGFLVGREDVVSAFAKLRSQIDFGMFFPIQKAAIACLNGPRDEVEAQRLKYQERRDALCDGLEDLGWERPNAHGSMFVWAKLPGGRTDSMAFCEELMEKAGVVVTPGASFGPSGEGHVRMALVLPPDQIALAVEAIREAGLY